MKVQHARRAAVVAALCVCQPLSIVRSQPDGAEAPEPVTVVVSVTGGRAGEPLPLAEVSLEHQSENYRMQALTGVDGTATFEGVPIGDVLVVGVHTGDGKWDRYRRIHAITAEPEQDLAISLPELAIGAEDLEEEAGNEARPQPADELSSEVSDSGGGAEVSSEDTTVGSDEQ